MNPANHPYHQRAGLNDGSAGIALAPGTAPVLPPGATSRANLTTPPASPSSVSIAPGAGACLRLLPATSAEAPASRSGCAKTSPPGGGQPLRHSD